MQIFNLIKRKLMLVFAATISTTYLFAQTPVVVAPTVTSGNNLLAVLLVIMTVVLAFVIWGLGQVLVALSRQALEKSKLTNNAKIVSIIWLVFLSQNIFAQATTTEVAKVLPNYGGLSANTFYMFVAVIAMEIFAIAFLAFSIRRIYVELLPAKNDTVKKTSALSTVWNKLDQKLFTKAVPIEKEADILLDHDYDGIQELDNALPPWWKYGFYITIAVAVFYLYIFHVNGTGKSPTQEYQAEIQQAQIAKEAYEANNKDKIDETNVPMA
ncbi:MAG: cbb3-type cytochrome c oxidase N-terminal domain-containing protein, partial [Ferruginibacter sp.]